MPKLYDLNIYLHNFKQKYTYAQLVIDDSPNEINNKIHLLQKQLYVHQNNLDEHNFRKVANMLNCWNSLIQDFSIYNNINLDTISIYNTRVLAWLSYNAGKLRIKELHLTGIKWKPPIPKTNKVFIAIDQILFSNTKNATDKAIDLYLYLTRNQLFYDGNKRTAFFTVNSYLINNNLGVLIIPDKEYKQYIKLLCKYLETGIDTEIRSFINAYCIKK